MESPRRATHPIASKVELSVTSLFTSTRTAPPTSCKSGNGHAEPDDRFVDQERPWMAWGAISPRAKSTVDAAADAVCSIAWLTRNRGAAAIAAIAPTISTDGS